MRAALGPPAVAAETDKALLAAGFVLAEGKLLPVAGRDFDAEPIQMLRMLQVARDRGLELHPLALRSMIQQRTSRQSGCAAIRRRPRMFMDLLCGNEPTITHGPGTASRWRPLAGILNETRLPRPLPARLGAHRRADAVRHLSRVHRR